MFVVDHLYSDCNQACCTGAHRVEDKIIYLSAVFVLVAAVTILFYAGYRSLPSPGVVAIRFMQTVYPGPTTCSVGRGPWSAIV